MNERENSSFPGADMFAFGDAVLREAARFAQDRQYFEHAMATLMAFAFRSEGEGTVRVWQQK